ncbi:hypothetical protein ACYSNM_10550 [Myroides sp. LJL116]
MMHKSYLLIFVLFSSLLTFAQKGIDPDLSYFFNLQKESTKQGVYFKLSPKDQTIEGNTSTTFFKVPFKTLKKQNNLLQISTGKIDFQVFKNSSLSRKNKKALRSVFNQQNLVFTTIDTTTFLYKNKISQKSMALDKVKQQGLYSYIIKHQWKVIQIHQENLGFSNQMVELSFDPNQNLVSVKDKENHFFLRYYFDFPTNTVHFSKIENHPDSLLSPKSKLLESTLEILNHQSYLFDVADQTLNLYKDDAIILMLAKFTY